MHCFSQVLQDRVHAGEKPGGPCRVTEDQTRYGQVAKQVVCTRESTQEASPESISRFPDSLVPRDRTHRSLGSTACRTNDGLWQMCHCFPILLQAVPLMKEERSLRLSLTLNDEQMETAL